MSTLDVLLLEDSEDFCLLLVMQLECAGHEVRVGRNGVDGLRLLDQRFPQIVITDVEMPVLDGPAMIHRMFVEDVGRENIPVILISANPRLREIALAVGTPYFLEKPFEAKQLFGVIARAVSEVRPPRPPALSR